MIDGQNFFDQSVKIYLITFNKNQKLQLVNEMVIQMAVY